MKHNYLFSTHLPVRTILLALSDRESGSPRQWLLLELAKHYPANPPSKWLRAALPWLPSALLQRLAPPPVQLLYLQYHMALQKACARGIDDAFLFLAATTALLAGFGRLPASQQFAVWLVLICGAVFKVWQGLQQRQEAPTTEEVIPGAEAALGLQGLLLARGTTAANAHDLLAHWQQDPLAALPSLLAHLPELTPPPAKRRDLTLLEIATWIGVLWPATVFLAYRWGWLGIIVLCCGLSGLLHHRLQQPGLIALTALLMFALARLIHWV